MENFVGQFRRGIFWKCIFKQIIYFVILFCDTFDRDLSKADGDGCSTANYELADGTICGSLQATDNGNVFQSFQGTKV